MPNNFPLLVGSGSASTGWQRPADWLPIPTIATGEEVVYILMAVYNVIGNFAAFKFEGNYTVDWGDGNIENFSSGVKAEHSYDWADVGNETSEGFRQALIKITPQAGSNLTLVDLAQAHSVLGSATIYNNFIEVTASVPNVIKTSYLNGIVLNNNPRYCVSLRHFNLISINVASTSLNRMFNGLYSLEWVEMPDLPNVTDMTYMHYNNYSLLAIPEYDYSDVTDIQQAFYYCYCNKSLYVGNNNCTSFISVFQNMLLSKLIIEKISGNCFRFIYFLFNLKELIINDAAGVTSLSQAFVGMSQMERCVLSGCEVGFGIANNKMSANALNEMFTSLGTADGAQTITITGNYGAATCDTSIATAKGYTVVN